jgi:hypothetical protein
MKNSHGKMRIEFSTKKREENYTKNTKIEKIEPQRERLGTTG